MEETENWIAKAKAKYAYAFDTVRVLQQSVGLSSYPSAILVDPSGRILFGGYPGDLEDKLIKKAVKSALTEPIYEWPSALEDAVDAMREGKLGAAITAAEAAGEEHAEYAAELVGLLDGRVSTLEEAYEEGDYFTVVEMAEELAEAMKGREHAANVEALVKGIKKDRDKRRVYDAQKEIRKILDKDIKRKDVPKYVKKLEKLREKFPNTIVDFDVDDAIAKLRAI